MDYCLVCVTVPDREVGERIAEALVAERLAACVNRVPGLFSVYRWQGRIERAGEELLLIKTRRELFAALEEKVRGLHPYTVPEIIALPITAGFQPYLDWLGQETAG